MLLKQALLNKHKVEADFPIKFSKVSKGTTAATTVHSVGLSKAGAETISGLKFPKKRTITKVVVHRVDEGHWHMVLTAEKGPDAKAEALAEKLIKIDLIQTGYRIIYNAKAEEIFLKTEYVFSGTKPTAEDIYVIVADVAKQKGKWTEGYNCQAFVNEVIERLATQGLKHASM
jgi:hypothetical protein